MKQLLALSICLLLAYAGAKAQPATWDNVYNLLSTNCNGSGCHNGSGAVWSVNGGAAATYNQLIGADPLNPVALGKSHKLVKPGYPYQSFLLRKVAHGLGANASSDLALDSGEGNPMASLAAAEVELIRQWILAGASDTARYNTADTAIINDYYNNGGQPFISAPAAPAPGQGIQLHVGPVFLSAQQEAEFFLKQDLQLTQAEAIESITMSFNLSMHNVNLSRFIAGTAANYQEGLIPTDALNAFSPDKQVIWTWVDPAVSFDLQPGLAVFEDAGTVYDVNLHAFNFGTQIEPYEVYINIYFDPAGQAGNVELKTLYDQNTGITIPPSGQNISFSSTNLALSGKYIWSMAGYTRQLGIDFDMFQRTAGGQKGDQLYEGMLDYASGAFLGFYDWEFPPVRTELDSGIFCPNGLIYEASYRNNTGNSVSYGQGINDEQMLIVIGYTDSQVSLSGGGFNLQVSSDTTVCTGQAVTLTASVSGGAPPYSFSWTGTNGFASTQQSPIVVGGMVGSVTYTVVVTDGGFVQVSDAVVVTETNNSPPCSGGSSLSINISNDTTVCEGSTVSLSVTASGGTGNYTYLWNDARVSSQINVSPSEPTTYQVTVTDGVETLVDSVVVTTSILAPPCPVSYSVMGRVLLPSGAPATSGSVVLYDISNTIFGYDTIAVTTLDATGSYSFNFGTALFRSLTMLAKPDVSVYPGLLPTYLGDGTVWVGASSYYFDTTSTPVPDITLKAIDTSGIATGTNVILGTVLTNITGKRANPIEDEDIILSQIPPGTPVAYRKTSSTGAFVMSGLGIATYELTADVAGIPMNTATNNITFSRLDDTVNVIIIIDSNIVNVDWQGTGITTPNMLNVSVVPNPSSGLVIISVDHPSVNNEVTIYNLAGSVLKTQQFEGKEHQLDLEQPPGIYFLKVGTDDGVYGVRKLVVH